MISEWSEKVNELVKSVTWIAERNCLLLWKTLVIYKIATPSWQCPWLRKTNKTAATKGFFWLSILRIMKMIEIKETPISNISYWLLLHCFILFEERLQSCSTLHWILLYSKYCCRKILASLTFSTKSFFFV